MKKIITAVLVCITVAGLTFSAAASYAKDDKKHHTNHKKGIFKKMDANEDGKITKEEFRASSDKRFNRMDQNDDGELTKEELAKHKKHMKEKYKEKHRKGEHSKEDESKE